jgi:hypothetical protein
MWLDVSSVTDDDDDNRQLGVQQARDSTSYFSLSNFFTIPLVFPGSFFTVARPCVRLGKKSQKPSNFHVYGSNFWFTFHCYFISWPIRDASRFTFSIPWWLLCFYLHWFYLATCPDFYLSVRDLLKLLLR